MILRVIVYLVNLYCVETVPLGQRNLFTNSHYPLSAFNPFTMQKIIILFVTGVNRYSLAANMGFSHCQSLLVPLFRWWGLSPTLFQLKFGDCRDFHPLAGDSRAPRMFKNNGSYLISQPLFGAGSRTWTGMDFYVRGMLSPLCLPIPPHRHFLFEIKRIRRPQQPPNPVWKRDTGTNRIPMQTTPNQHKH